MIATEYIKDRAAELRRLREESRAALRALGAKDDTPLLQAVCFAADDLDAMAGELERLSAQHSDVSLRGALLGFLRAEGYGITEPAERKEVFAVTGSVEDETDDGLGSHDDAVWEREQDLHEAEEEPLPETTPFDEPEPPVEYRRGMTVRLVGNGLFADRHAILHDETPTGIWFGELTGSTYKPTRPAQTLPLSSFATTLPDPDKQPSLLTNTAPAPTEAKAPDVALAETPATSKPTRAPEADKPVADWNPNEREIGEMAAIVGHTIERTAALIAVFKTDNATAKPQARWRVPFCKWAKAQPRPT